LRKLVYYFLHYPNNEYLETNRKMGSLLQSPKFTGVLNTSAEAMNTKPALLINNNNDNNVNKL